VKLHPWVLLKLLLQLWPDVPLCPFFHSTPGASCLEDGVAARLAGGIELSVAPVPHSR